MQQRSRTLWALAVLAMLRERAMHPYEMTRVMHQRHTDELLALKRGSLYHAINQLLHDGLIEVVETSREGRRPERTVYQLTPEGGEELGFWLRDLLANPTHEPSQFMAALAFIRNLSPEEALEQLRIRVVNLSAGIGAIRAVEQGIGEYIGRVSVLEVEYLRSLYEADLAWVRAVVDDIEGRRLRWSDDDFKLMMQSDKAQINFMKESGNGDH